MLLFTLSYSIFMILSPKISWNSIKAILFLLCFFGLSGWVYILDASSYFQPQFECSFINTTLNITSTPHPGSKNCLQLISSMKAKKEETIKQITTLYDSSNYNQSVRVMLIKQRNDLDTLITKTIEWVNNLEAKLFVNYKKKYNSKLKSIRKKLVTKQGVLTVDLIGSINDGQQTLTVQIIKTIGLNYQRIKLIDGILTSTSLDEMVPLLDTYEQIITSQLSWKSE